MLSGGEIKVHLANRTAAGSTATFAVVAPERSSVSSVTESEGSAVLFDPPLPGVRPG